MWSETLRSVDRTAISEIALISDVLPAPNGPVMTTLTEDDARAAGLVVRTVARGLFTVAPGSRAHAAARDSMTRRSRR